MLRRELRVIGILIEAEIAMQGDLEEDKVTGSRDEVQTQSPGVHYVGLTQWWKCHHHWQTIISLTKAEFG